LRLAAFNTVTIGLKYGHKLANNQTISTRLEMMLQAGNSQPTDAIGEENNQDIHPDLSATILQFSYSFIW